MTEFWLELALVTILLTALNLTVEAISPSLYSPLMTKILFFTSLYSAIFYVVCIRVS